jgi:hypothetical protein
MIKALCFLAFATTAVAAGYIKREFETEYVKTTVKRDIPDQDLDENITLTARRSVSLLSL